MSAGVFIFFFCCYGSLHGNWYEMARNSTIILQLFKHHKAAITLSPDFMLFFDTVFAIIKEEFTLCL